MENVTGPETTGWDHPPKSSIVARFFNIIASPGEVYLEIKQSPPNFWNWLLPVIVYVLVGSIFTFAVFSQKNILQQIRDLQSKAIQDGVAKKKIPPESVSQIEAFNEKFGPTMMKVAGGFGVIVYGFVTPFVWGFILWLLADFLLKSPIPFMLGVEAAGIAMPILLLGMVVSSLLTVALSRLFSTPSLALFVSNFDLSNKMHLAMGAVNLFYLWMAAVMGIALATLTGKSLAKSMAGVFGVWVVTRGICLLAGMGQLLL